MATAPGSSDTLRRYFEAYNTHDSEAVRIVADESVPASPDSWARLTAGSRPAVE